MALKLRMIIRLIIECVEEREEYVRLNTRKYSFMGKEKGCQAEK